MLGQKAQERPRCIVGRVIHQDEARVAVRGRQHLHAVVEAIAVGRQDDRPFGRQVVHADDFQMISPIGSQPQQGANEKVRQLAAEEKKNPHRHKTGGQEQIARQALFIVKFRDRRIRRLNYVVLDISPLANELISGDNHFGSGFILHSLLQASFLLDDDMLGAFFPSFLLKRFRLIRNQHLKARGPALLVIPIHQFATNDLVRLHGLRDAGPGRGFD